MFRQPNLARTLRAIVGRREGRVRQDARQRRRRFAPGATHSTKATSRAESRRPTGRPAACSYTRISPHFTAAIEKPTTTNFHGFDVYKAGPWNQGPVLLQTLNILEGIDLAIVRRNLPPNTSITSTKPSSSRTPTATRTTGIPRSRRSRWPGSCPRRTPPNGARSSAPRRHSTTASAIRIDSIPSVKPPPVRYTPHSQGTQSRPTRRYDVRRRRRQGWKPVQRHAKLRLAARRRIHRRRHRCAAVEPDDRCSTWIRSVRTFS